MFKQLALSSMLDFLPISGTSVRYKAGGVDEGVHGKEGIGGLRHNRPTFTSMFNQLSKQVATTCILGCNLLAKPGERLCRQESKAPQLVLRTFEGCMLHCYVLPLTNQGGWATSLQIESGRGDLVESVSLGDPRWSADAFVPKRAKSKR